MPIIQAYQCPRTGKLFSDKQLYLFHLKSMAKENRLDRHEAQLRRNHHAILTTMRKSVESLNELSQFIIDNSATFYFSKKLLGYDWDKVRGQRPGLGRIRSVQFYFMRYSNYCSNSHNAPIGKPENWHRDDNKPLGYPGWKGRMKFVCDDRPGFMSDMFKHTGIHIHTGGDYDVTLFADDWPGLVRTAMINKLAGGSQDDIVDKPER